MNAFGTAISDRHGAAAQVGGIVARLVASGGRAIVTGSPSRHRAEVADEHRSVGFGRAPF